MLYLMYMTAYFIAKLLPTGASYAFAEFIARLYYFFCGEDRETLKENLKVVLGDNVDEETLRKNVFNVFRNFAKYLVDFLKFTKFTEEYIAENIEVEGQEHIEKCLSEGKGVILLTLHLGNWELGGAVVGGLKYPVNAIVLEHDDRRVNDFFVRQRALNGLKSIPIGVQVKECFRALKNNGIIAIVGDKDYTSSGTPVDFFGRKALMPRGPAVFSLRTGAPIILCSIVRKEDDSCKIVFEDPIKYVRTGDHDKDVEMLMLEYLKHFERYIRKNPDQWYAFKKLWDQEKKTQ